MEVSNSFFECLEFKRQMNELLEHHNNLMEVTKSIFMKAEKTELLQPKVHSVSSQLHDFNQDQPLPEIIGEWFDMENMDIIGYEQGDCTSTSPKLDWRHFLHVQKINETRHPKTRKLRVKVLAWTKNGYKNTVILTAKYKNK